MNVSPARASWATPISHRLAAVRLPKMIGTAVGIGAFFPVYFWLMHNPLGMTVHTVPALAIDAWIPIQEWAFWPYASLWFYVSLAAALAKDAAQLAAFARSSFVLCAIGFAFFALFPTAIQPESIDWQRYPALQFMKTRDGVANAFPSLHVGFAVLSAAFVQRELRASAVPVGLHLLNLLWAGLILYSVFGTRQHVVIDALGGVAAAIAAWRIGAGPAPTR